MGFAEVSVVTDEILDYLVKMEQVCTLQQVLSGNNTKRSVLCAFVGIVVCFIVNCGLFKISPATTRSQFFSLVPEKKLCTLILFLADYRSLSLRGLLSSWQLRIMLPMT